jgi:hypothetical protein
MQPKAGSTSHSMHFESNVAHWVCLLAGLYLVLTAFLLRDIVNEHSSVLAAPGTHSKRRGRVAAIGRRTVLIAVGLAAVIYGILRMVN